MGLALTIMLIVGLPFILIGVGFFLLALKAFRSGDARTETAHTLEQARRLEQTLSGLESRLTALEDIIISSGEPSGRVARTKEAQDGGV